MKKNILRVFLPLPLLFVFICWCWCCRCLVLLLLLLLSSMEPAHSCMLRSFPSHLGKYGIQHHFENSNDLFKYLQKKLQNIITYETEFQETVLWITEFVEIFLADKRLVCYFHLFFEFSFGCLFLLGLFKKIAFCVFRIIAFTKKALKQTVYVIARVA